MNLKCVGWAKRSVPNIKYCTFVRWARYALPNLREDNFLFGFRLVRLME